jgi:hypothetical protein
VKAPCPGPCSTRTSDHRMFHDADVILRNATGEVRCEGYMVGTGWGEASCSERSSVSASRTISEPGTREFELPLATHPARHAVSAAAPRSTAGPEKQDKG